MARFIRRPTGRSPRFSAARSTASRTGSAVATLLCAAAALHAQPGSVRGYATEPVFDSASDVFGFDGFAAGPGSDELYYAHGGVLYRTDPSLTAPSVVRALPPGQRFSMLHVEPATQRLYYTLFASGALFVRDLTTGLETGLRVPANSFDLAVTAAGEVLVTANPSWPAPGSNTGIWLVDPGGGPGAREVVRVTGPSGPLWIDPQSGDLTYALQSDTFPTPPGAISIVRFRGAALRSAIAGGPALTMADAELVAAGLDGAFDLTGDRDGVLYVSDPRDGSVTSFDSRTGNRGHSVFAAAGGWSGLWLQWRRPATDPALDAARFAAWQPAAGGELYVAHSDYATRNMVRRVRPRPLHVSLPGGNPVPPLPFDVRATDLPAHASGWMLLHPLPLAGPQLLFHQSNGLPLFSALDWRIPAWAFPIVADGSGTATLRLPYRGGSTLRLYAEAVATTGAGDLVGSDLLQIQLLR